MNFWRQFHTSCARRISFAESDLYRPQVPGEHYRLIVAATRAKVSQNTAVQKVLLATGDLILKPDHYQEANPPAPWRYYEILTQIRGELQKRSSL